MGEKRRRSVTKTSILAILVVAVFAAAVAYVWSSYGSNRALTLAAAGVIVFALAWLIVTLVSFLTMASAGGKRENDVDEPLTNTQRAVPKRAPILPPDTSGAVGKSAPAADKSAPAASKPDPAPEAGAPTPPPVAAPPPVESAPTADGTTPTPQPGRRRKNPGA